MVIFGDIILVRSFFHKNISPGVFQNPFNKVRKRRILAYVLLCTIRSILQMDLFWTEHFVTFILLTK